MGTARDILGAVYKNGSATLLARVVGGDGQPIVEADVASASYTVLEVDPCDPDGATPVAGHDGVAIDPADAVFDTLQTDALWDVDAVGYNFRHAPDVSTDDAFPRAGRSYLVRYELVPQTGQKLVFRFLLRCL